MATITGTNEGETLTGMDEDDTINALGGNDIVSGAGGNDTIDGGGGNDIIDGDAGEDTINGGTGRDEINGGAGVDILNGGSGNDTFFITGDDSFDDIDGSFDIDLLDLSGFTADGASVDLAAGVYSARVGASGTQSIVNVENVTGTDFDDTLSGDDGANVIQGLDGNDFITGGGGSDRLEGGNGNDLIIGDDNSGTQTTASTVLIPSTGEQFSVSLTLPDTSEDSTIPLSGFVSRTPVTSSNFNVAFVIDISGSTNSIFNGAVDVIDANGDGRPNTILDAEILGIEALLGGLQDQAGAANLNVSIIGFESSANTVFSGNSLTDNNGNGVSDALDALRSLQDTGGTDFQTGLQETISFFNNAPSGQNIVFFLSDGENNTSDATFADEVTTLLDDTGIDASIRAFGVGTNSDPTGLDLLDDGIDNETQVIVTDPSLLSQVLIDPSIDQTDVDRVEILLNGNIVSTISGSDLVSTPLGLNFSFETILSGLQIGADDTVEVRAIGSDPDNTVVSTIQVVEDQEGTGAADEIFGDAGNDVLFGGVGDDFIDGGTGNDVLIGEEGNDTLNAAGEESIELPSLSPQSNPVSINGNGEAVINATLVITDVQQLANFAFTSDGTSPITAFTGIAGNTIADSDFDSEIFVFAVNADGQLGDLVASNDDGGEGLDSFVSFPSIPAGDYVVVVGSFNLTELEARSGFQSDSDSGDFQLTITGATAVGILPTGALNPDANEQLDNDIVDGGDGIDTADYTGALSAVNVDLNLQESAQNTGAGFDTLIDIENLTGSAFSDVLIGDSGNNVLQGGAAADTLTGGAGSDTASYVDSNAGVEVTLSGVGIDAVTIGGDAEGDMLSSIENLTGSAFADILTGNGGNNVLEGGLGADNLNGGDGTDTASYENSVSGVQVSLNGNFGIGGDAQGDEFSGIENLTGSALNDGLTGNVSDNLINGGAGDDNLFGGGGDDVLNGGSGDDLLSGGDGNNTLRGEGGADFILAGQGDDIVFGGDGEDRIVGQNGDDEVFGQDGNDDIFTGFGDDELFGGNGDDMLNGGADNDDISGGSGIDTILGGAGVDIVLGGAGNDDIGGGSGSDILNGGSGNDNIFGFFGSDTINGDSGNDTLNGFQGQDIIDGGNGNDDIFGGDNGDMLFGGLDDDALRGQNGNDTLDGGTGNDTLNGGAGTDRFIFAEGYDSDRITDFDLAGTERIDVSDFNLSNFAELQDLTSQLGATARLDFGGGDILLINNTDINDLSAADFVL